MLGSSAEAQNNIEENTHIAKLCDLLERIWGHGLKRREVSTFFFSFYSSSMITYFHVSQYMVHIETGFCLNLFIISYCSALTRIK